MTVYEAIEARRSVRHWSDRDVPQAVLTRILSAVRLAPSARNLQEWRFVVVRDPQTRVRLAESASGQSFVGEAPIIVVACAESTGRVMRCGHPTFLIDVSIALDHLTLAAVSEGLGTCWIGSFDPAEVRRILGIPARIEVVELMPLGYPAREARPQKKRLALENIVMSDVWE